MTHNEKLDAILLGLLSRVRTRIEKKGIDDERLTLDFICKALFENKGHEDWETEFLKRRLLSDGMIEFNLYENRELPDITDLGIKFIQDGGYKNEGFNKNLERELRLENLKSAKRSKIALVVSVISVLLSAIYTIIAIF